MRKISFTILLVIIFSLISVLGVLGIAFMNHSNGIACPLAFNQQCADIGHSLSMAFHHISELSVVNVAIIVYFIFFVAPLIWIKLFWDKFLNTLRLEFNLWRYNYFYCWLSALKSKQKLMRWRVLTIHQDIDLIVDLA